MNPSSNRARTSPTCASARSTAARSTSTVARAVTSAQYTRVTSRRKSTAPNAESCGAPQRVAPSEGQERPFNVEPRAVVVRNIGIDDAGDAPCARHRELLDMVRALIARQQRDAGPFRRFAATEGRL